MAGLFDRVKSLVNIKEYIELETGIQLKRVGSGSWRLIPCLFCDSQTGCTINESQQFFKCFSCHVKGDVIEFEQRYRHLESPLEAAKSVANKRGIPILDGEAGGNGKPRAEPKKPDKIEAAKTETVVGIDPGRAAAVRRMAAEYYHNRLMTSRAKLAYQTDVRQHSREILGRLMVGLGGGSLIAHCRSADVSIEELMAVGLVQERKEGGYSAVVSAGVTVYPHFSGGDILFFSLKDPEKKKKWQLKKDCAPKGWLCYGQDALEQEEPVIVVEGENDRITAMDRGKYEHSLATIASYNEPAILGRLKEIAKGRTWYLAFDNDPALPGKGEGAGARYTREYANTLLAGGGDVRVIRIEPGKDGRKADIDDMLRAAEDPVAELARLMGEAKKITQRIPMPVDTAKGGKKQGVSGPIPPAPPDAYEFKTFEVLGELKDERILFWSRINERLYAVALKDFNLDKLVQVGGVEIAIRVARALKTYTPGQVLFSDVKKRVIVAAGKRQLWDPEYLGQGLHGLGDRLVLVVGGRAWVWDGKQLTEWKHPVIEARLIDWRQGHDWVRMPDVIKILKNLDRTAANDILDELLEIFFQWGFTGRLDVWLVTGWHLAQYLQSMWSWRPHLWLTGTAGSGKTLMNELFGALSGRLTLRCEGQTLTEPGLRQSIGCDSVLVAIDEIEKSQKRDDIIYYIRSAGRGGVTRKGSSGQKAVSSQLKHMVFLSSIERGIYRAAENSRYLTIETRKSNQYRPVIPNSGDADQMRVKIMAYVLWASHQARKLVEEVGKIGDNDPRFVESLAVAFSMLAVSFKDPREQMGRLLSEYLEGWRERFEAGTLEDEAKLVEDIMMAQVKVNEEIDGGELRADGHEAMNMRLVTRTVSQLVEAKQEMTGEARKVLEAHGVKQVDGKGLFLHPDTVVKSLLARTQWQGLNIREMLLRVVGAEASQLRLGGSPLRGVLVPWVAVGL